MELQDVVLREIGRIYLNDSILFIPFICLNDNVIGVVENPYTGEYNSAYVLSATNQIIWNVSDLFIAIYGSKYYGGIKMHFVDVRIENGSLYFFINISNCDFRFSFNIKTGEIGRLVETR